MLFFGLDLLILYLGLSAKNLLTSNALNVQFMHALIADLLYGVYELALLYFALINWSSAFEVLLRRDYRQSATVTDNDIASPIMKAQCMDLFLLREFNLSD